MGETALLRSGGHRDATTGEATMTGSETGRLQSSLTAVRRSNLTDKMRRDKTPKKDVGAFRRFCSSGYWKLLHMNRLFMHRAGQPHRHPADGKHSSQKGVSAGSDKWWDVF